MSRSEYDSLRNNAEVILKVADERELPARERPPWWNGESPERVLEKIAQRERKL